MFVPNHRGHAGHPLRLAYSDHAGSYDCLLFYKRIDNRRTDNKEEVEGDPNIPRLPCADAEYEFGIVGLLNKSFLTSTENGNNEEELIIDHYSHPEHSLFLEQEAIVVDYEFFLHRSCALVPDYVSQLAAHPYHGGVILQRQPWSETRVFECSCCREYCNGFSYRCPNKSCGFEVDLECAFLPSTIIHKSHSFHPLALENTSGSSSDNNLVKLLYKCCGNQQRGGRLAYRCTYNTCDFQIHIKCSLLPAKTWHIFDSTEPFKLTHSHHVIEPANDYYCDICEKDLDLKLWFYYTNSCYGQVMHPRCLSSPDGCPNANFKSLASKSIYRHDIHRHHLYVSPCDMRWCHHCQQLVQPLDDLIDQDVGVAYKCWWTECDFVFQMRCAQKLIHLVMPNDMKPEAKAISSPVPESLYPMLAFIMLSLGLTVTAAFFIYEATTSRKNRSLAKELTTGSVASVFLGFGSLFLLLASGVYV
ncbi:hypothetical protein LIER_02982 [Lithospermum erythrorhizon]|uniref:DC1 domain-containing protein n=1 Tax=Lithospermum erythrorhizon TaxID=34254 RepID=A0AAV3NVD8_LITER